MAFVNPVPPTREEGGRKMPTKQFKVTMYGVNAARLEGSGEPTAFQEAVTIACNTQTLLAREKVIADKRHRLNDSRREGNVFS